MSKKTRKEKTVEEVAKKLTGILNSGPIAIMKSEDVLRKTGAGQIQVDAILLILNKTEDLGSPFKRSEALRLLRIIADRKPDLDFSKVIPKVMEIAGGESLFDRDAALLALSCLSEVLPRYNFSTAVPVIIANLEEGGAWEGAAHAIGSIHRVHPDYDFSPALPRLVRMLENSRDIPEIDSIVWALEACEPRSHADLSAVRKAGMSIKHDPQADLVGIVEKEGWGQIVRELSQRLSRLYSAWSAKLGERADALVDGKKFPVPKIEKPDKTERILRVRRSRA